MRSRTERRLERSTAVPMLAVAVVAVAALAIVLVDLTNQAPTPLAAQRAHPHLRRPAPSSQKARPANMA